jgi:hypothetical protein
VIGRQQPPSAAAWTAMITAACSGWLNSAHVFLNVAGPLEADA